MFKRLTALVVAILLKGKAFQKVQTFFCRNETAGNFTPTPYIVASLNFPDYYPE